MQAGNTVRRLVGRLIEIRLDHGYRSVSDVETMLANTTHLLEAVPPEERVIIASDWRRCSVMSTEAADRAVAALASVNPRTIRSALLIKPDSPTAVMQLMRVVGETHLRDRKVFTSPEAMSAWLAEVTTPDEHSRLLAFLTRSVSSWPPDA